MSEVNLLSIIKSDDPLSDSAISYLLNHKEEDKLVDYKEAFDPTSEKSWLDLNVDVVAFANTHGGFLVFGVQDKTYEVVGLSQVAFEKLCDIKQLLEKVNRYIQPEFSSLRSKGKEINGKKVVFLFIPQSRLMKGFMPFRRIYVLQNRSHRDQSRRHRQKAGVGPIYLREG